MKRDHVCVFVWFYFALWWCALGRREGDCFRFTWLGPAYNNSDEPNITICNDVTTSPCMLPLLNTVPRYKEIWNSSERENYTCRLDPGSVCAKWIHYFDGEVVNVSHMCTKISVTGEGAMKSGCITQYDGVYSKEVCACRTLSADTFPCNYATNQIALPQLIEVLLFAVIVLSTLLSSTHAPDIGN